MPAEHLTKQMILRHRRQWKHRQGTRRSGGRVPGFTPVLLDQQNLKRLVFVIRRRSWMAAPDAERRGGQLRVGTYDKMRTIRPLIAFRRLISNGSGAMLPHLRFRRLGAYKRFFSRDPRQVRKSTCLSHQFRFTEARFRASAANFGPARRHKPEPAYEEPTRASAELCGRCAPGSQGVRHAGLRR